MKLFAQLIVQFRTLIVMVIGILSLFSVPLFSESGAKVWKSYL